MSKIVASLEDYDSILDAPRPNCTSKTWYLREEYTMSIPKTMGHWNIIDIDNGELWKNDGKPSKDTHFIQSYIDYKFSNQIDGKHLYIINAANPSFFYLNENIGFSVIKEKYIDDIRNNKSAIIIVQLYEGAIHIDEIKIVEKWAINQNISPSKIHLITGNLSNYNETEINIHSISAFEPWINEKFRNDDIICHYQANHNKLFLSYNRQPRTSRLYLGSKLLEKNLLNCGLFSMISIDNQKNKVIKPPISDDIFDEFVNLLPLTIDGNLSKNKWYVESREHYEKTFVSIVTETLAEYDRLFISEKTWKPIVLGHPFMIVGNKNTLLYLKSIGYKTFSNFWDESYDECDNWCDRVDIIVQNIYELSKKSADELIDIYTEIKPILVHNKNNFKNLFNTNWDVNTEHIKLKNILFDVYNNLQD